MLCLGEKTGKSDISSFFDAKFACLFFGLWTSFPLQPQLSALENIFLKIAH